MFPPGPVRRKANSQLRISRRPAVAQTALIAVVPRQHSSSTDSVSTVVEAVRKCLTDAQTRNQAPRSFGDDLMALSPTDSAFLCQGLRFWFAFFPRLMTAKSPEPRPT